MAASSGFVLRLPFLFMGAFFAYATYVQLNDPDKWLWMLLYGVAAVASFFATLGFKAASMLLSVIAAAGAATLLSTRLLLSPPTCELGERVLEINGHKLSIDVNTELGRENSGLLIMLTWNLLAAVTTGGASLPPGSSLALLGVAGAVVASAVLVPAFVMSPDKLKQYPHCSGLGITPQQLARPVPPEVVAAEAIG